MSWSSDVRTRRSGTTFAVTGRTRQESPANRRVADRAWSAAIPVDCCSCTRVKDVAGAPRPITHGRQVDMRGSDARDGPRSMRSTTAQLGPAVKHVLALLEPARRPPVPQVEYGYLDLLGNEDPTGAHPGQ